MNAERLHAIVKALEKEMDEHDIVSLMNRLVSSLRSLGQTSNANTQQSVASARSAMYQALENNQVDQFSPTWKQVVRDIGGEDLFGEALLQKIRASIEKNQMTPSVAAEELEPVRERLEQFHDALTKATAALDMLKIGDEKLDPGECEIGLLIPRAAVGSRLLDLTNELEEFGFILNTFSEVVTGKTDDLTVETISSSDFLIYLLATPAFAACISSAVGAVLGHYKNLLEIRKLQLEIQKLGVPDESARGIGEYANQYMENGIEKVTVEIVKQFHTGKDTGRKNELTTAVRVSLNMIANRIDQGYNIEVRCEPRTAADKSEQAEKERTALAVVQANSANMQFLKLNGKPLLKLSERANDGTKTIKKKGRSPKKNKGEAEVENVSNDG